MKIEIELNRNRALKYLGSVKKSKQFSEQKRNAARAKLLRIQKPTRTV